MNMIEDTLVTLYYPFIEGSIWLPMPHQVLCYELGWCHTQPQTLFNCTTTMIVGFLNKYILDRFSLMCDVFPYALWYSGHEHKTLWISKDRGQLPEVLERTKFPFSFLRQRLHIRTPIYVVAFIHTTLTCLQILSSFGNPSEKLCVSKKLSLQCVSLIWWKYR